MNIPTCTTAEQDFLTTTFPPHRVRDLIAKSTAITELRERIASDKNVILNPEFAEEFRQAKAAYQICCESIAHWVFLEATDR
ncbi:hypothetical protein HBA55_34365 [Pseudomaricurvus alkylphenolicus]|uniref:hypothetical protein n=1 Tax=Pseudomaricurvus alkylphenolicus TaxID=1306991 RepID=UPI00141DEA97|nr:hypothetical protein [Pseudomaricurvus alkylphenolicus]NIB44715.1 hypothetical protein [Pseudomaricurvus alkylphenolicus]